MGDTYDIFVGSLMPSTTQESLTKLFGKFGKVVKTKLMDHTNSSGLKFGFVHYKTEGEALKAIEEMSDFMCNGIPLQVKKSDKWLERIGGDKIKNKTHGKFPRKTSGRSSPKPCFPSGGEMLVKTTCINRTPTMPQIKAGSNTSPGKILKESLAVTHVEDPVTFYAYLANKHYDMNKMTTELQNFCPTLKPISGDPRESQIYGSMYSVDRLWYRCKILKTDKNFCRSHVQYIDFGNMENVSNSSLVELPARLRIIPPFALKCVLKNLAPQSKKKNHDQAMNYIKTLLIDQIISGVLHAVGSGNLYHVSEINQNGVNIIELMIKNGHLVHSFSPDTNRNTIPNGNISGGMASNRKLNFSDLNSVNNYSNHTVDQEKSQLKTENRRLKYELAQAMGKHKALQEELKTVNQSISEPNPFTELPDVLAEIERVRLMRQQLPVRSNCIDYIDTAISLLSKTADVTRPLDAEHRESIQQKVSQYYTMQKDITQCKDKEELQKKIEERNLFKVTLLEELTAFCSAAHSGDVIERTQAFKTVLSELQKTYKTYLERKVFSETALPIEELHNFYTSTKAEKAEEFLELQRQTDMAHRSFFRFLQPAFQNLDHRDVKSISVSDLTKSLNELKVCLAEEIQVCAMEDTSEASVVGVLSKALCEKLEMELSGMEETERLEKEYNLLVQTLNSCSTDSCPPAIEQLTEMRKERKKLKSQLRHILADKIDLEENDEASDSERLCLGQKLSDVQWKLQETFLEEDKLIATIAHLQEASFPEMDNLYPDFGLQEYNKYKGLVKSGLEIEHFNLKPLQSALQFQTHYSSTFMGKPIRLQEYQVSSEAEKEALLRYILQYSAISHPRLMPIDAVFLTKKFVHAYVEQPLLPSLQSHLEESKVELKAGEILRILKGVLQAICALHSRGLLHGCLHPATVFLNENKEAIVDSLPFQPHKCLGEMPPVNGIVFQLMDTGQNDCSSYDIYSFACLLIWLLYPKTEFQLSSSGKPITEGLPKASYKSDLMELANQILESPTSYLQASEIQLHPAINQSPQLLDQLQLLGDAEIDLCTEPHDEPCQAQTSDNEHEGTSPYPEPVGEEKESDCDGSSEDESYNPEETLLAYDSIRMNQCSLGLLETV